MSPYKNKEDTAGAVRRYRQRKKEEKEQIEAGEELQKTLGEFLEELGFKIIPYRDFVEITQQDCIVEKDGIRSRRTGKLEAEPEVFFGLNMLIVVDTVHIERKG